MPVAIHYRGIRFAAGFRADPVADGKPIVAIESTVALDKVHKKQLLTWLRPSGQKPGYLLNFGEALMKDGIVRIVNGLPD